ncbi:hypothetical protein CVT25_002725 [Psilocybe cyanescens]|uniref:Uncharacterized protein n=1 Tax=Psilocybe cyanescens TaxID=93625 RepID=A0A409XKC6_PSICY|nr:hypothetical protein CVT25_002725 [Psilocybe cyanescens]
MTSSQSFGLPRQRAHLEAAHRVLDRLRFAFSFSSAFSSCRPSCCPPSPPLLTILRLLVFLLPLPIRPLLLLSIPSPPISTPCSTLGSATFASLHTILVFFGGHGYNLGWCRDRVPVVMAIALEQELGIYAFELEVDADADAGAVDMGLGSMSKSSELKRMRDCEPWAWD